MITTSAVSAIFAVGPGFLLVCGFTRMLFFGNAVATPGRVVRHHSEAGVRYEVGALRGAGANLAF